MVFGTTGLMKILHAAETIKGGVATVMRTLALAQSDENTVRCLVPADQAKEMAPFRSVRTFSRSGRNLSSILSFGWNFTKAVVTFRPHVVHLHSTFAGVIGRILLVFLWPVVRPKVVYMPHGWAFIMDGSHRKKNLYATIERILYPFTSKVICVSQYEADEARRFGLPTHKTVVIYNGTPTITAEDIPNPYNTKLLNLLFVGRLDFQKGFDVMLDAMERLAKNPDAAHIHLTVVGEGDSSKVKISEPANMTSMGWLSLEKLIPFFAHADVVVVPSRWEGFSMVPLEAMSYGVPVVASNISSLPEVVESGKTGLLFSVADSLELSNLLANTPLQKWREMGQHGQLIHNQRFTVEIMTAETIKIYARL